MNTGPLMNNNPPQGRARGVNPNDVTKLSDDVKKQQTQIVDQIKNGTIGFIKTLFMAGLILFGEAFIIWKIIDYVFETHALTYGKTFLCLLAIRLIFRTTVFDKKANKL
jgi:uncharacterized membrane protein YcjF (UPF0283 family)